MRLAATPICADSALAWRFGPNRELHLDGHHALSETFAHPTELIREKKRLAVEDGSCINPITTDRGEYFAISCPVLVGEDSRGVVSFYVKQNLPPATHAGYLHFVETVSQHAARFEQLHDRQELLANQDAARSFERFTAAAHKHWDPTMVAYHVANEGRLYLDCDRLTVAVRHGKSYRVTAVSGVAVVDRRSQHLRQLEQVVAAVAKSGETVICRGDTAELAPQVADPLEAYFDLSAVGEIVIVPLKKTIDDEEESRAFGAVVVEQLTQDSQTRIPLHRLSAICEHASLALGRAVQLKRIPFFPVLMLLQPVWRWFSWRNMPRLFAGLLGLVILIAALCWIPADFRVTMRGQLQPVQTRNVFASVDGVVVSVQVEQGTRVSENDPLILLESKELELEAERVAGELTTAQERLESIDAERLQLGSDVESQQMATRLSAEEMVLKLRIESLQQQSRIIASQLDGLQLTSPITGDVLTWDLERSLVGRPVQRGQALLLVSDLQGPWKLEFEVPDESVGHVLRAAKKSDEGLALRFVLANEPEQEYNGVTTRFDLVTQTRENQRPAVLVEADFDRNQNIPLRPGALVVAKVDCGRRSVGFVWFHEIFEEVRRRLF